jgi:hypothetical protein
VPPAKPKQLLDQLDKLKHQFDPLSARRVSFLLKRLAQQPLSEPQLLIQYHEILLFLVAYPRSPSILRAVETQLRHFSQRVKELESYYELSTIGYPEVSGIAGTQVTDTFSYYIVQWLKRKYASQTSLSWDWFEDEYRLGQVWPRFLPLLAEDALVEANVPYRDWLRAARGRRDELAWLLERFARLPLEEQQKEEMYDSQKLYVRWAFPYPSSRTGLRLAGPGNELFLHRGPLIQRRDISFPAELQAAPPTFKKLTVRAGEAALDLAREASTVRYRELYGFTHGDPKHVIEARLGRGVVIFVIGLPAQRRLPLRAYHAAMIFKNRVPIGYFEGLSLCERMESGFNLYYTFRDGETAWLYARTLNVMHHLFGVTAFTLDPYQIGFENDEGIASGAFWFYRKLGFRPTRKSLLALTLKEEAKIKSRARYRTATATLKQLAAGSMIFELEDDRVGDWDNFQVRKIGLATQRLLASRGGDQAKLRQIAVKDCERTLAVNITSWSPEQQTAFGDFSPLLYQISDLNDWTRSEKDQLVGVIKAKAARNEATYLKLMQKHHRLRREIISLGSGP